MRRPLLGSGIAVVLLVSACTSGSASRAPGSPSISSAPALPSGSSAAAPVTSVSAPSSGTPTVTGVIAQGLTTPWGLAFLPDGSALLTERDTATIKRVRADGRVDTLGTVPGVDPAGEGGLLGIAVTPDYATSARVIVFYTAADDDRIAALTVQDGKLGAPQVLLTGIAKATVHNGGRLAFGPDGLLYVGTGDGSTGARAQDVTSLNGKILRLTVEGKPAPGNPFPNSPHVFSWGHRNVQGLAFDPSGHLWASEFGQDTWDELNLVHAGDNDGWPVVEGPSDTSKYVALQRVWPTDQASPSGIAVADGAVWMAALHGARLWKIPLTGDSSAPTGSPVSFFDGTYGRLRTVVAAPDGSLWITTSNTDGRVTHRPATT